jgi:toxin ParE1/3/4
MTRVVVSQAAQSDVETIIVDLALKAGHATAVQYIELFEKLYRLFERFPASGSPRPNLGHGVRIGIATPYIMFYRYDRNNDLIYVQRVLHSKRNVTRAMLARKPRRKKE